jgi:hypothetical protein
MGDLAESPLEGGAAPMQPLCLGGVQTQSWLEVNAVNPKREPSAAG